MFKSWRVDQCWDWNYLKHYTLCVGINCVTTFVFLLKSSWNNLSFPPLPFLPTIRTYPNMGMKKETTTNGKSSKTKAQSFHFIFSFKNKLECIWHSFNVKNKPIQRRKLLNVFMISTQSLALFDHPPGSFPGYITLMPVNKKWFESLLITPPTLLSFGFTKKNLFWNKIIGNAWVKF